MQFIFDNLVASVVAGIVLFMLLGAQLATQRANVDANLHYMNRVHTRSLVEMIERDFPNIGAGVEAGADPMIAVYDWTGPTRRFEFWAVTGPSESATVERIQYVVSPSEAPACQAAGLSCWKVERQVDAGSGFRPSGASTETLTEFEIELSPNTGNLRDVREVRVRLSALSPAGDDALVGRSVWETSFRPYSLSLQ